MNPESTYRINEIFYTLQGEGIRAGVPSVFVRFSGCNLACDIEPSERSPGGWRCDTEFTSGQPVGRAALVALVQECAGPCRWIVLTGGEPALQVDLPLVRELREAGFKLAIETNGTCNVDALEFDWLCVSPKTAEHTIRQLTAHELKYVRAYGQSIPKPRPRAEHYLISPAFEADGTLTRKTLQWCTDLVMRHPLWRLSVQTHKLMHVR